MNDDVLCIEGGGSRTWVGVDREGATCALGGSTAFGIAGGSSPHALLVSLLRECIERNSVSAANVRAVAVFHSAASTRKRAHDYVRVVTDALARVSVSAYLLVANDMLPILYTYPRDNVVALIAGTGTSAGGRRIDGALMRVGGGDFVLSDEGGGFEIGFLGLRSVVKSLANSSSRTLLDERALSWIGWRGPERCKASDFIEECYESIYGQDMRTNVAAFAKHVLESAALGDLTSRKIVDEARRALEESIAAVASGLGFENYRVVLSGSLVQPLSLLGQQMDQELSSRARVIDVQRYVPSQALLVARAVLSATSNDREYDRVRGAFPCVRARHP